MYTDSAAAGAGHHPLRVNRVFQRTTTTLPEPHGFTSFQGSNRVLGLRHFDVQMMGGELFFGRAEGGWKGWKVEGWLSFGCGCGCGCCCWWLFFGCKYSVCLGGLGGCVVWNKTIWHFFCWETRFRGQSHWQFLDQVWSLNIHVFVDLIFLPCQEITMDINIYIYHEKHADRRNHSDSMTWYQIIIARLDILGCAAPMMRFLTRDSPKKTQVVSCPKTLFQGILGGWNFSFRTQPNIQNMMLREDLTLPETNSSHLK